MLRFCKDDSSESIFFEMTSEHESISVSEWVNDSISLSYYRILQELVENGYASNNNTSFMVPIKNLYKIDNDDLLVLNFPDYYPFEIEVRNNGIISDSDFSLILSFKEHVPLGNILSVSLDLPFIRYNDLEYLLHEEQYQAIDTILKFNANAMQNKANNLTVLDRLKKLAESEKTIKLCEYLLNENVYFPDKIQMDIELRNNELIIKPLTEFAESESFERTFTRRDVVKDVYRVQSEDGSRINVCLTPSSIETLKKVKQFNTFNENKKRGIIDTPSSFFDPETDDFSFLYSDRVIELGLYKPKYYAFICPYQSQWIPSIRIEDKVNGNKNIFINTLEKLEEFENMISMAVNDGNKYVSYEQSQIPLETAQNLSQQARKLLVKPKSIDIKDVAKEHNVLIIEENAESLGYVIDADFRNVEIDQAFCMLANLNSKYHLKEHQRYGVSWLIALLNANYKGCLLADDMGLGKTLQILYFIEWYAQNLKSNKPILVVCPVSLIENWKTEYKNFFEQKTLDIVIINQDISITKNFSNESYGKLSKRQILLTNYETIRNYQHMLCAIDYSIVVLDEAQKIKTPGTLVTNAVKSLKAEFKITSTGTPVENTLVDLWCIYDFILPGFLGSAKDFKKKYEPVLNDENSLSEQADFLRKHLGSSLLRREKTDVLEDLPKKYLSNTHYEMFKDIEVSIEMPDIQANYYKNAISLIREGDVQDSKMILEFIHKIKKISDHPYLIDKELSSFSIDQLVASSAKLKATLQILERIKSREEKVIIFVEFKATQKLMQTVILGRFNILSSIINGDTSTLSSSSSSRQKTIDIFQKKDGFNCIIMSPIAAGVGLNVTAANHIIHYSRHWNPAKEDQATDRAYRIGQIKDVYVYYPQAKCNEFRTFDLIIDDLLKQKRNLATSFIYPTEMIETKVDDLYKNIISNTSIDVSVDIPLTLEDVDTMKPDIFEAFVGAIYREDGFKVLLSSYTRDKGADVIAIKDDINNELIQVKHSINPISYKAASEVVAAKKYYENKYNCQFNLTVASNNYYTNECVEYSRLNNVKLINRDDLILYIDKQIITIKNIQQIENTRYQTN